MLNNAACFAPLGELNKTKLEFIIDVQGIIEFNKNLGSRGIWGDFDRPFAANHFMTVDSQSSGIKKTCTSAILDFRASSELSISVGSKSESNRYQLDLNYIKFKIIGVNDFDKISPRHAWKHILNLEKTDGAIGADGSFYLGELRGTGEFTVFTCDTLNAFSYNLEYQVGFTIMAEGQPNRYCVIDPLIRTSTADDDY